MRSNERLPGEPTVAGMSMREVLHFERSITNPAGIEWVIGSGADVGAVLYMVAPVASAPGPSALYQLDPTTGEATILGSLGIVDPTDIAWDKDRSTMYLIDKDSDALYTVRQIQAPSPPIATGTEHIGKLTRLDRTGATISAPRGLAFVGSMLYMVDDNTDALYTVDTTTGVATRVGSAIRFGILVDANGQAVTDVSPRGLAWDGTNLYMMTNDMLYTLSTTTGIAIDEVGELRVLGEGPLPTPIENASGIAWNGTVLYMVDRDTNLMYTVDKTTGLGRRANIGVMKFGTHITPSGLASRTSVLYMGSVNPGELYTYNTSDGVAIKVGSLGISSPTAFAWHNPSSTLYVVDDGTDALYKVTDLHPYLPNVGDLYYNGGNFADAFLRWDNPSWIRGTNHERCATLITDCSTYEHDLILDWKDNGGWFDVGRTPGIGRLPNGSPFCTTWSDLPEFYDDCPTAGVSPNPGVVELSFGTFKAPLIEPGRDYYGYWRFDNQRGTGSTTSVELYGQEGEYDSRVDNFVKCPSVTKDIWCIFGIGDGGEIHTGTTWSYDTPSYLKYSRP